MLVTMKKVNLNTQQMLCAGSVCVCFFSHVINSLFHTYI